MIAGFTKPQRGRLSGVVACAFACSTLLAVPTAQAVLGGDASTIGDDQTRLKGVRRQVMAPRIQVQTHEIAMADGSSIREYVSPGGIVFAVAWNTRFKPHLEALLGQHAASYAAAASDAMRTPGIKRNVVLQRDDLVVHSTVHLNSFVGKAYVRSLVPTGINVDDLR